MKKLITAAILGVSIMCFTGIALGVTQMNQPAYSRYFPLKITKPGSYQLVSNITVPNADTTAILVTVDNVTIDLNGFAILGPTVCTGAPLACAPVGDGIGIDAMGHKNIKVYNGSISGMGNGGVVAGYGSIIDSVRAASNGDYGIGISSGTVSGNTVTGNGFFGIFIGSGTVSGNTVTGNGAIGIALILVGTVNGNAVTGNGGDGIVVGGEGMCTVSGNTASDNGYDGITCSGGTCMVNGNTVGGNGDHGLVLGKSAGYANNALANNTGGDVTGGLNLGQNLCGSALCK